MKPSGIAVLALSFALLAAATPPAPGRDVVAAADRLARAGDLPAAIAVLDSAIAALDPDAPDSNLALLLHTRGRCRHRSGDPRAVADYEQAISVWRRLPGLCDVGLAKSLNNLGIYETDHGDYEPARLHLQEALALKRKHLPDTASSVVATLNSLGGLCTTTGAYDEAEYCLTSALGPGGHPAASVRNVHTLQGLTMLYHRQRRYRDAVRVGIEACQMATALANDGEQAISLNNLAREHLMVGNLAAAETCAVAGLRLASPDQPWSPTARANLLFNLGCIRQAQDRLDASLLCFCEAESLARTHLSPADHLGYVAMVGEGEMLCGHLDEAEAAFEHVLAERQRLFGPVNVDVALAYDNLASLALRRRSYRDGLHAAACAMAIQDSVTRASVVTMTEPDALSYAQRLGRYRAMDLTFARLLGWPADTGDGDPADAVLLGKGLVTDMAAGRRRALARIERSGAGARIDALRALRRQIASLRVADPGQADPATTARRDSLVLAAADVERELASLVGGPTLAREEARTGWRDVARRLPARTVLLDYLRYWDFDDGAPRYVLVALAPDASRRLFDLGPAAAIDADIAALRAHMARVASLPSRPTVTEDAAYRTIARALHRRLVAPARRLLGDCSRLIVSPDGDVAFVPFAALVDEHDRYLVDRYTIEQVLSGRDLAHRLPSPASASGTIAFVNPDLSRLAAAVEVAGADTTVTSCRAATLAREIFPGGVVSRLPHGPLEASAEVDSGLAASEWRFKTRAPGHAIVQVTAHGFALPGPDDEDGDLAFDVAPPPPPNPLLDVGVLLSGSCTADVPPPARADDGVLTAAEVASLDFTGTRLVVLAACGSGLGPTADAEGVFGLRRAFLLAGARTVVSALWDLPARSTAPIVTDVVAAPPGDAAAALRAAQQDERARLRRAGLVDHPYTWAGLVVTCAPGGEHER